MPDEFVSHAQQLPLASVHAQYWYGNSRPRTMLACRAISQVQADSLLRLWERDVMLGTLDDLWLQYLLETQRLQRAVNLRCGAINQARGA